MPSREPDEPLAVTGLLYWSWGVHLQAHSDGFQQYIRPFQDAPAIHMFFEIHRSTCAIQNIFSTCQNFWQSLSVLPVFFGGRLALRGPALSSSRMPRRSRRNYFVAMGRVSLYAVIYSRQEFRRVRKFEAFWDRMNICRGELLRNLTPG